MRAKGDSERRFAIVAALLLPYLMLLVADWTVTPLGLVDAWIYRALGRDLIHANSSMGEYYYAARPFVLVPRYLLTRFLLEGVAHVAYGLICAHVLLLSVLEFLTSVARPGTRLLGVLVFGSCMYLLRALGWGYIDGSLITWFMVGLAGVARWYRPDASSLSRRLSALVAGGCFAAMLVTHPMTLPMLLTPLGLVVWLQRQTGTSRPCWWVLWLELTAGGVGAVLLMGALCELLYGRFLFFMPIAREALQISGADWKQPVESWLFIANWLLPLAFACLGAGGVWAVARVRRLQLTAFEGFAYLNLVALLTLIVGLQLFTEGYWLEYSWFVSYFLPAGLLALAAVLGERLRAALEPRVMIGLFAVMVGGAALAYRLEVPFALPPQGSYFPFKAPAPLGTLSLTGLQLIVAGVALVALLTSRWLVRRPGPASTLFAGGVIAAVVGGPINLMGAGDGAESAAADSIAQTIVLIQDELKGQRPAYWYDDRNPLARLFLSISSGHLASHSHLGRVYPAGARAFRTIAPGANRLFASGDPVIILDETMQRFARAQRSFSELGITLAETRRVRVEVGEQAFWLVFARLEPRLHILKAVELGTTLKGATSSNGDRVSEREKGFLSFGPYVPLAAGSHRVTFRLRVLDTPDGENLGSVDVGQFAENPLTLQRAQVLASAVSARGELDIPLEFTAKEAIRYVEFRTFSEGNSRLSLRSIDVETPGEPLGVPHLALAAASSWMGGRFAETVKSADIKTSGIAAHLEAEALGTGRIKVKAALLLGLDSQSWVETSAGDTLTATVGSTTRSLEHRTALGATWYEAEFEGDAAGTSVRVSLARQSDPSAMASIVALPPPIVFTGPGQGAAVARTQGLEVTWASVDKGGGALHLSAAGPCIEPVETELPADAGRYTFPAFTASRRNELTTCKVVITLTRSAQGTLDPAWGKGGDFEAAASNTLAVSSAP